MKSQLLPIWLVALTQVQASGHHHGHQHIHRVVHEARDQFTSTNPPTFSITTFPEPEEVTEKFLFRREYDELTGVPEDIIPSTETVTVSTSVAPTGTAQVLPSLASDVEPHTSGFVLTSLNATGQPTEDRLIETVIPEPTSLLQPLTTTTTLPQSKALSQGDGSRGSRLSKMSLLDLFSNAVDTKAPPSNIKQRSDHPVPRKGLSGSTPFQTNKFYSNFFLGDQQSPTFTFPYSIVWAAGSGASTSWGMSVSHIEARQRVFGDKKFNNAAAYFINPLGIQSMVISAKELGKNTFIKVDSMTHLSARVHLAKDSTSAPAISFPVVQGMAYVTAQYNGAIPLIQTGVYFRTMTRVAKDPKTNVAKYNFLLEDGTTWRVYAYKTKGDQLDLKVKNNGLAEATKPFYGIIQVVKDPKTSGSEALLDDGAGIYPVTNTLSGSSNSNQATYTFTFTRAGHATGNLYMFALPHHVASFTAATRNRIKSIRMQTTTKGVATLVQGNTWTMAELLTVGMGFAPWDSVKKSVKVLSTSAKNKIKPIAQKEISQDMAGQSNLDSMYFSGKVSQHLHRKCDSS